MVWIKWDDYGKKTKKRTTKKKSTAAKKSSRPSIEPRSKIIPGKHKVEFKKASELRGD